MSSEQAALNVHRELLKLSSLGGNHGFMKVHNIASASGADEMTVRRIAVALGLECKPHGPYGYCVS